MDYLIATVDQLSGHLKALRKARGLTQAQLGALLGVKQVRIAEIEADPGLVSMAQMHKLLAALGVQISLRDKSQGWQINASARLAAVEAREPQPMEKVMTHAKAATPSKTAKPVTGSALAQRAPSPSPGKSKKRGSW